MKITTVFDEPIQLESITIPGKVRFKPCNKRVDWTLDHDGVPVLGRGEFTQSPDGKEVHMLVEEE